MLWVPHAVLLLAGMVLARRHPARAPHSTKSSSPAQDLLLFQLRSQLMAHNYDYEEDSPEMALRTSGPSEREVRAHAASDEAPKKEESELSDFSMDRNVLNGYLSEMSGERREAAGGRAAASAPAGPNDRPFPRTDAITSGELPEERPPPPSAYLAAGATTRELSYKVLTAHGMSRRSGAAPRYLQAALNHSLLVAPLGRGPLPTFRLPKNRRQYREDSDEADSASGSTDEDSTTGQPSSQADSWLN